MQLRKNIFTLSAAALLAGAVACGDDDGNGPNGPNGGNGDAGNGGNGPGDDVITGDVTDLTGRGQWGGLVLDGLGITNDGDENNEVQSEAADPATPRYFGGDDNSDDSGTVTYTIIAESGFAFQEDQEVQGLTLEAVGDATTIDYIQVIGSEDDCTEWFGGAVNVTHLVCNGQDDDGLDIDLGYVGNIQYAFVSHGSTNGDRGIESDSKDDQLPITAPNIANVTLLGNSGKGASIAALHQENFGGKVFRSVYTDNLAAGTAYVDGCVTYENSGSLNGDFEYQDVVFNCSPQSLSSRDEFAADAIANGQIDLIEDPDLTVDGTTWAVTVSGAVPAPNPDLPAGIENAGYHGAVDPAATTPWFDGWTYVNSGVDGGLPGADSHPLQDDIEGGQITGADAHGCASVNPGFVNRGFVTIFGERFPVCEITGDITEDTSLPNNHVFVYNREIRVGSGGDQLSGNAPPSSVTLTIAPGTQIYAQTDAIALIAITRGSQIDAQGTAAQPIIFGAAEMNLN